MKNKNKPRILDNLGLKIIAICFAVFLWIFVTNTNDPVKIMTANNVQVRLLHTNLITDQGQVYTVLDGTDTVPVVTVRAKQSILNSLQPDNIYATADVNNITALNTVEIRFASTKYNSEIDSITGSISNVKLSIEERRTKSLVLTATTQGEVADGYQLGTVSLEQNQVRVAGPASVVDSVVTARVTVDVSGATSLVSTYDQVHLLDENGNDVDTTNLTMNITSVKITAQVSPISDIPILAQYQGTPADGYLISGVLTVEPSAVELSGKSSVLSTTQSIVIPADQLDITGRTSSLTKSIDITPYIPSDLSIADSSFDGVVTVTVGIVKAENVNITAQLRNIRLDNVPAGYNASVVSVSDGVTNVPSGSTQTTCVFQFEGLPEAVTDITADSLAPYVDVGALLEGQTITTQTVLEAPVQIVTPDNATLTNTVNAGVQITPLTNTQTDAETGEDAQVTDTGSSQADDNAGTGTDNTSDGSSAQEDNTTADGSTGDNGTDTQNSTSSEETSGSQSE